MIGCLWTAPREFNREDGLERILDPKRRSFYKRRLMFKRKRECNPKSL